MTTRDELVAAIAGRYAWSGRLEKGRILDEFGAVTKLHRKHAQRLLRQGNPRQRSAPRPGRRIYDEATNRRSGTFLPEAIRILILIVALQCTECENGPQPNVTIWAEAIFRQSLDKIAVNS
jgi:hypothetical protein